MQLALHHIDPLIAANMSVKAPSVPAVKAVPVPADSSVWDRISNWASENKAVVYTIAGVAIVATGAGVVYYVQSNSVSEPRSVIQSSFPAGLGSRGCLGADLVFSASLGCTALSISI